MAATKHTQRNTANKSPKARPFKDVLDKVVPAHTRPG
jgi:hypothetical protein